MRLISIFVLAAISPTAHALNCDSRDLDRAIRFLASGVAYASISNFPVCRISQQIGMGVQSVSRRSYSVSILTRANNCTAAAGEGAQAAPSAQVRVMTVEAKGYLLVEAYNSFGRDASGSHSYAQGAVVLEALSLETGRRVTYSCAHAGR